MIIPRGAPAQLSASWFAGGDPDDPGDVTVTITGESGAVIAEDAVTGGAGANPRTFDLTIEDTTELDVLTAVWTSEALGEITTVTEIRGDLLFSIAEARAYKAPKPKFGDATKFPDQVLIEARDRILEQFEDACGVAFGSAFRREVLDGTGTPQLLAGRIRLSRLRGVAIRARGTQTFDAIGAEEVDDVIVESWGLLTRETIGTFPLGRRNVRVDYEHGYARIPLEIRRAALEVAVAMDIPSDIDPRATSFSDGIGTYRFVTPGLTRGAITSLPEVNEVLQRYDERLPNLALGVTA